MLEWYTSIVESSCAYSGLGRHIYLRMENFQLALQLLEEKISMGFLINESNPS